MRERVALPKQSTEVYRSLRAVALGEVSRLEQGDDPMRQALFTSGRVVAEVTIERLPAGENDQTALVTVRDVTDQLRIESELSSARARLVEQQRMRVLGELSAGIAHDLNNLLAAISYRLATAPDEESCGVGESNLAVIRRIVASSRTLLTRLQSLGKPNEATPVAIELGDVVLSAIEVIGAVLKMGSGVPIRVRTRLFPTPPILASEDELRSVIINLLLNARDAMPAGGTIELRAARSGHEVVLSVEDEGSGISPEHLPHIFEPFFTTKGAKGTGMGLAMAKQTVERSGGSITARNRPGGGACFELRFLAFSVDATALTALEAAPKVQESGVHLAGSLLLRPMATAGKHEGAAKLRGHRGEVQNHLAHPADLDHEVTVPGNEERGDHYPRAAKRRK